MPESNSWYPRNTILCFSILCNALSAGGVFLFPLFAPELIFRLKLTQPQLTAIVWAGMAGQYPFSSIVGKAIDKYGSRICSLAAALAFSVAFGLSAWEIKSASDSLSLSNDASARRLTLYFAFLGLGTVLSYFSFVFAASKTFPAYISIASGTTMALFGLSPLFLSSLASTFFTNSDSSLDIVSFLVFMTIFAGVSHLLGAVALDVPSTPSSEDHMRSSPAEDSEDVTDETTGLLQRQRCQNEPQNGSVLDLLRHLSFWILCLYLIMTLGTCEMVFSNVGTIVLSLPSRVSYLSMTTDSPGSAQVKILSISNTLSRLLVGPLADFLSPAVAFVPVDGVNTLRRHWISRVAFLSFAATALAATCSWMLFGVQTQQDIWVLSIGTGLVYGCIFTVLPSITCSIWGMPNLARNFGIITYSPFVGTTVYSYLYVIARSSSPENICYDRTCWELTFWICFATSLGSLALSLILWKSWKGML
ncbi:MFS general substrate transporter [Dendrothele bispora CBS 962.96]|uniref:MFS general substrate transporter n=1 Tax=Dendrothele bispora (strain CBS 962.96) TaxID=1314807 RepID=A0A4S8LSE1_DENBC|nr:MFS general substrate transporter [Dendrothele bispora CBS 962.96]